MKRFEPNSDLAAIRNLIREKRLGNSAKAKVQIALTMEERRIGGPLPPSLKRPEIFARLVKHWEALGYTPEEMPSERQLKHFFTGH